jgi:hypothetical protein
MRARLLLPGGLALALGACANLPSGGRNGVRLVSDPPGAAVTTSFGASCTTPCVVQAPRDQDFEAVFERQGRTVRINVRSVPIQMRGVDVGNFRVGLNQGGGGIQDPLGRFNREHVPNPVVVRME